VRADSERTILRIALAPDAPVVVAGTASLLRSVGADVVVVDLPTSPHGLATIDVVLYDPQIGPPPALGPGGLLATPVMVAFSWSVRTDTAIKARSQGAAALLSKHLAAAPLLAAIRAAHSGRRGDYVVGPERSGSSRGSNEPIDDLSPRELEMLQMITEGLSNDEIARSLFLSINSVKTYIRAAYRKIGVTRRPQAVLWGVHHGFASDQPLRERADF
jgi:NarL family two-component system response regulator LiaR